MMTTNMDNINTIQSSLKALSLVRSSILDILKYLSNTYQPSKDHEKEISESADSPYMSTIKSLSNVLETRVRELEAACTLLYPFVNTLNFHNTQMIALDANYEKTSLYPDLVISYRWLRNTQEYSAMAFQALQTKFIKRNTRYRQRISNRPNSNNHNMTTVNIEQFLTQFHRNGLFDSMPMEVVRPFGAFTVLKVVLDRTLRAVIVLRGLVIEWVLIKSYEENFEKLTPNNNNLQSRLDRRYPGFLNGGNNNNNNNFNDTEEQLDIWKPSRYRVFRTITDHANAAILHFYAPFQMESAIKAFMIWFRSYQNLFSAKCRKCDSRLLNDLPPTWRDFRSNDPYHFECRP